MSMTAIMGAESSSRFPAIVFAHAGGKYGSRGQMPVCRPYGADRPGAWKLRRAATVAHPAPDPRSKRKTFAT